jgi:transcriptional regulator with XRE-family HTH domain
MPDKQSISKRILEIRKKNKLNQIDFADSIEITQQSLSQVENGIIAPSLDIILKITSKYCISHEWLLTGEGDMLKGKSLQVNHIPEVGKMIPHNHILHSGNMVASPEFTQAHVILLKEQLQSKDLRIEQLAGTIALLKKRIIRLKKLIKHTRQ